MSQRMTRTDARRKKRNSRLITFAWIVGVIVLVIILLYKEKADWLYVLATLGVTALLVIVSVADLGKGRGHIVADSLGDDAAAIGSAIPATATSSSDATATASAPSDWRGGKNRKPRRR